MFTPGQRTECGGRPGRRMVCVMVLTPTESEFRNSVLTILIIDGCVSWDAAFCQNGASSNACSETYCGASAFSEKESKAMADLVAQRSGNIAAYFAIHSYSQLWMYPYGYKNALPSNSKQLEQLSAAAVAAIKNTHGLNFQAGPIATTICMYSFRIRMMSTNPLITI